MTEERPIRLLDRLRQSAEIWAAANDATLARIGRAAINDSSYFTRPEPAQGPTTGTLERFARFLGDTANWPDGAVPDSVLAFVHVVGVTPSADGASPGKADEISPTASPAQEAA